MLAQPGDSGRRIEDDLRAVQPERARAFGKMAVVADVDADLGKAQVENRIAQVARPEVEFLPEARGHVRNMRLAVLAEVGSVVLDHRGGVVVDAFLLHLIYRYDQRDMVLARQVLHETDGGPAGNGLGKI